MEKLDWIGLDLNRLDWIKWIKWIGLDKVEKMDWIGFE